MFPLFLLSLRGRYSSTLEFMSEVKTLFWPTKIYSWVSLYPISGCFLTDFQLLKKLVSSTVKFTCISIFVDYFVNEYEMPFCLSFWCKIVLLCWNLVEFLHRLHQSTSQWRFKERDFDWMSNFDPNSNNLTCSTGIWNYINKRPQLM